VIEQGIAKERNAMLRSLLEDFNKLTLKLAVVGSGDVIGALTNT
jgi:type I restriction enzyme M protein